MCQGSKRASYSSGKFDLLSSGFSDPELDVIEWCLRPGMFSFKTRCPWKRAGGDNFNLQGFPEMCQKEHYPDVVLIEVEWPSWQSQPRNVWPI